MEEGRRALLWIFVVLGRTWSLAFEYSFLRPHDSEIPREAVTSVLQDGKQLMGRQAIMFSYPADRDKYISPPLQNEEWFDETWKKDCETLRHYSRIASATFNYLDIGANIGTIAVPIALCLSSISGLSAHGKVIAVEALPEHVELLRANLRVNFIDNAMIWPYALGSETHDTPLMLFVNATNKAHATFLPHGEIVDIHADGYNVSVPISTVDAMYKAATSDMRRVLMMKMDIEGAEGHALVGAQTFLDDAPPCYLNVELRWDYLYLAGSGYEEVMQLLERKGYNTAESTWVGANRLLYQRNFHECLERVMNGLSVAEFRAAKSAGL
jgi:FkbM family methyltransferase